MALGFIDRCGDRGVEGWLIPDSPHGQPYVTVGGIPAPLVETGLVRKDVCDAFGIAGDFGFRARLPRSFSGTVEVVLHEAGLDRIVPVTQRTMALSYTDGLAALDLEEAVRISREPGAVAVVVWDAAHNPVGRAKVLHDIVATRRPVVVFGFCHPEFGGALWAPLRSSGMRSCLVRPAEFERFRRRMRAEGVAFDTIWMCKPRLPTFLLADALAHERTAFILDIDDNEEAFARSEASRGRWYGEESVNKANHLLAGFKVRSVASGSLQARYGGEIVRHGRKPLARAPGANGDERPFRLAFIGTVHPHKGLLEAARAVRVAAVQSGRAIRFAVGGTFHPSKLAEELAAEGVEIIGPVPSSELQQRLSEFDAVLTGFPAGAEFETINRYQISSKIGDALSVGIPALVPLTEAVADLAGTPGVHLFELHDFGSRLVELARGKRQPVRLPDAFDVRAQYATFAALEAEAARVAAGREAGPPAPPPPPARRRVLIVWKQSDSGLYGRRVDQVAASLARRLDGAEVTVVEFVADTQLAAMHADQRMISDATLLLASARAKLRGVVKDGVRYESVRYCEEAEPHGELGASGAFRTFLDLRGFDPASTVVILFPILRPFDVIQEELARFLTVVDVVDNQVSWSRQPKLRAERIAQYRALSDAARTVIFNSSENMRFMVERGLCDAARGVVIGNWYSRRAPDPAAAQVGASFRRAFAGRINVLYSGNMNDRIDWDLLEQAAVEVRAAGALLHLFGASERAGEELRRLLRNPACIYHGPAREEELVGIAEACDFAIVPHRRDTVSSYMNPLKVKMYDEMALPHLVTAVDGVDAGARWIRIAADEAAFLAGVRRLLSESAGAHRERIVADAARPPEEDAYCRLVEECFDEIAPHRLCAAEPAPARS